jgi:3-hydroxybutyryl-CoA dehydrogenase
MAVARLSTTTSLDELADADLVIEAAPERLDLKQRIFEELDRITPASAILATNTSTLSVTQIASTTATPERVVGIHFFNPPPLMPLIEVVEGAETAAEVMETAMEFARRLGKKPVRVKDVPGFIVNRVARPFHLEGLRLLEQGAAPVETIDHLFREAGGFRMGPFELQDLIGLDINYAASQSVYDAYHHAPRFRPSPLQRQKVESGHLGKKTGRGWYRYDDETRGAS